MVNSNADALGIIFPNSYDSLVPELVSGAFDGLHPFCRTLPYGRLYFVQHGQPWNWTIFPLSSVRIITP